PADDGASGRLTAPYAPNPVDAPNPAEAPRPSAPIATQQSPRMPPGMVEPRTTTEPPPVISAPATIDPPPPYRDEEEPQSAADPFPTRAAQDPLAKTSKSPVAAMPEIANRLADLAK